MLTQNTTEYTANGHCCQWNACCKMFIVLNCDFKITIRILISYKNGIKNEKVKKNTEPRKVISPERVFIPQLWYCHCRKSWACPNRHWHKIHWETTTYLKFITCLTNFYFHWSSMDSHVIFLILSIMTHLYIILITTRIKTIPTCRQTLFPWGSLDSFVVMITFSLKFSQS